MRIILTIFANKLKNNIMKTQLEKFAAEINAEWTDEYSALIENDELKVKHNGLSIVSVNENLDINILKDGFSEVVEQLIYMLKR